MTSKRNIRLLVWLTVVVLVIASCSGNGETGQPGRDDLPAVTAEEFKTHLESIDRPAVVNIWASWCLPSRDLVSFPVLLTLTLC